jgi:hypothetical protein
MRRLLNLLALLSACFLAGAATAGQPVDAARRNDLRPPTAFSAIADQRARSIALFQEAAKVIESPRCLNCHPAGDRPTQTDAMRPHEPLILRGADGHGVPGQHCVACHPAANFDVAHVPGHPDWHLAPLVMAWQGKTTGQLCEQIKDPARNGSRDAAALIQHVSDDTLVGWAWQPGFGRTSAPGTQAEFGALIRAWFDSGAYCPPA